MIGHAADDPSRLESAAAYLRSSRKSRRSSSAPTSNSGLEENAQ
jgi:hypothetical protein